MRGIWEQSRTPSLKFQPSLCLATVGSPFRPHVLAPKSMGALSQPPRACTFPPPAGLHLNVLRAGLFAKAGLLRSAP